MEDLEKHIRKDGSKVALDLEQVSRVDVEAVHFLGACEARGVRIFSGSLYIRD